MGWIRMDQGNDSDRAACGNCGEGDRDLGSLHTQWFHRGKRYCMYDAHTINCILRAHKGRKIVMARDGRAGCSTLQSLLRNPECAFCSRLDTRARVAVSAHGVVHRQVCRVAAQQAIAYVDMSECSVCSATPRSSARVHPSCYRFGRDCKAQNVAINPHCAVVRARISARDTPSSSR